MALIKCPECGKEISDTAKNCINCGYVLKEENNTAQPKTVIVAPEKGKSAKNSLNKGVTIVLFVLSISFVVYILANIFGFEKITNEFYSLLGPSLLSGIVSIVMSILIFAVPKLRKKWFEIVYILVSIVAWPISLFLGGFVFPAFFVYAAGIIFIIKSMFIKD